MSSAPRCTRTMLLPAARHLFGGPWASCAEKPPVLTCKSEGADSCGYPPLRFWTFCVEPGVGARTTNLVTTFKLNLLLPLRAARRKAICPSPKSENLPKTLCRPGFQRRARMKLRPDGGIFPVVVQRSSGSAAASRTLAQYAGVATATLRT